MHYIQVYALIIIIHAGIYIYIYIYIYIILYIYIYTYTNYEYLINNIMNFYIIIITLFKCIVEIGCLCIPFI